MGELNPKPNDPTLMTPNVPPPPAEVKVRTMRSDIEGVAKSGGGLPQFKMVPVEGMGLPKSRIGGGAKLPLTGKDASASHSFPWWIVVAAAAALGVLCWFGYTLILKN